MSGNRLCRMVFQQSDGNIVMFSRKSEFDDFKLGSGSGVAKGWDISGAETLKFSAKRGNLIALDSVGQIRAGTRNAVVKETNAYESGRLPPAGAIFKAVLGGDCNLVIYVNDDVVWTWNEGAFPNRQADDMCRVSVDNVSDVSDLFGCQDLVNDPPWYR